MNLLNSKDNKYLVFGSRGQIGNAVFIKLNQHGRTYRGSREVEKLKSDISQVDSYNGVVWAHGINRGDSILSTDGHHQMTIISPSIGILGSVKVIINLMFPQNYAM